MTDLFRGLPQDDPSNIELMMVRMGICAQRAIRDIPTLLHPGLLLFMLARKPFDGGFMRSIRVGPEPYLPFLQVGNLIYTTTHEVVDMLDEAEAIQPLNYTDFCGRKILVISEEGAELYRSWCREFHLSAAA